MTKMRAKGKVLPFRTKPCSPDAITEGACGVIGNAGTRVDDPTSKKQPVSGKTKTEIQVTMNFDPWCEEGWQSSPVDVDNGRTSDRSSAEAGSPEKKGVTVEEMRWLLSNPVADSTVSEADVADNDSTAYISSESKFDAVNDEQASGTLASLQKFRDAKQVQYPVLDKIVRRFAAVASKRVSTATGHGCRFEAVSSIRTSFDAWLRMQRPVASAFSMLPQQGSGLIGMERPFANALIHALFGAGEYEGDTGHPVLNDEDNLSGTDAPIGYGAVRHLLHLLLLDMEWAFAPYFEIECSHSGTAGDAVYQQNFSLDDSCTVCEFSIQLYGIGKKGCQGTMMIVFSEQMIAGIESILTGKQEILVPDFEVMDEDVLQRLRLMADDDLFEELNIQPPLSAAVILSQLSDDRRNVLLAAMDADRQEAINRRVGHRAGIETILTETQQVVASILALGEAHAAQVVSSFSLEAAAGFLREAAKLPSLYPEQVQELLKQKNSSIVSAGALIVDNALVRRIMIRAIAPENMAQIVSLCRTEQVHMPFAPVLRKSVAEVASKLQREPVAVCRAIVLFLLKADREYAHSLLQLLPNSKQLRNQLRLKRNIAPDFVTVLENSIVLQLTEGAGDDLLAPPQQERWAVSGTVEWLLDN